MILSMLLWGCAVTRHPTETFAPASAQDRDAVDWAAVLDNPTPISVEHILSADTVGKTEGLVNLDHPDAQAAGLEKGEQPIVIAAHLLRHPEHGTFLFDSGVATDADGRLVAGGLVRKGFPVDIKRTTDTLGEIDGVFISHMHIDHVLGLSGVPDATVYTGPGEAAAKRGGNALLRRTIDMQLGERGPIQEIDFSGGNAADVFGDGSLWALHVPGHTPGSVAYLVNAADGPVLLVGDACHTTWGWENSVEPGHYSSDIPQSVGQLDWLIALTEAHPQISVAVGHNLPPIAGEAPPADAHTQHVHEGAMQHRFDDVEHWAQRFDAPERDAWQKPAALVEALGIEEGQAVADIGAGTGYFLPHLAAAVGASGTVYAVDVEPSMVNHMTRRAHQAGLMQVQALLGEFDDPKLAAESTDLLLMVNTYHHVSERVAYFSNLRAAARPGGRLVIVDFTLDTERGPPPAHRLSPETVTAELSEAGWTPAGALDILDDQYVLIFE